MRLVGNPSCIALQARVIRKPVSYVDRPPLRRGLIDAVSKVNGNAWHDPALYARPLPLDRPVQVTTKECPNLRMTTDDSLQSRRILRVSVSTNVMIVNVKGWMVHEQTGRLTGSLAEYVVEPFLPSLAENPFAFAGQRRIERH